MQKKKKGMLIWLAAMLAVMAVIFCFSAQAGEESSQVSNGVLEFLMKWKPIRWVLEETPVLDLLPLRKWGHFTVYFLLGITSFGWMRQVAGSLRHSVAGAAAICFLYACSDEFHQLFVPGRAGQWRDVGIDSMGAAFGISIWLLVLWILRLRRRRAER